MINRNGKWIKKKKKKIKFRNIIILFISIYIVAVVFNQNKLKKQLRLEEEKVLSEISMLQEDIEDLNIQIEKKGSIEFLENTAREELGMVKPNEIIYIDRARFKNSIFNFLSKSKD